MRTLLTVFAKEVVDNFRDRRTLASALIMGPLFGPMLFAFVINLSIERSLDDVDRVLELPVIGQQHAPNLMAYLGSHNIEVVEGPDSREAAVKAVTAGEHDVVVILRYLLEDGGEGAAWTTPGCPKVDDDERVVIDRLFEILFAELHDCHERLLLKSDHFRWREFNR